MRFSEGQVHIIVAHIDHVGLIDLEAQEVSSEDLLVATPRTLDRYISLSNQKPYTKLTGPKPQYCLRKGLYGIRHPISEPEKKNSEMLQASQKCLWRPVNNVCHVMLDDLFLSLRLTKNWGKWRRDIM